MAIFRGDGGAGDANNTVTINEVQQLTSDAQQAKVYAQEWANKAEDSLVSSDAGGDGVDDYSSLHHAAKAQDSEVAAQLAETNAETAQAGAETAQTAAELAETNAEAAQAAAETAQTGAELAETNAATSETNAASSASAASTSASNAATSETNAAASESAAATSETNAASSASSASTSASNAATSETNAATSESNAATSETNAATSETDAAASATAAAASATEASTYVADQTGNAGKFLQTDGSDVSWQDALVASDIGVTVQGYSLVLANTTASFTTSDETAIDNLDTNYVDQDSDTGAANLPTGTSAQRPASPAEGMFRRNSETGAFEGYDGTSWTGVGGAAGGAGNPVVYENDTNVTADYTITTGKNAMSAGPITIDSGVTLTVPSGSVWTIV